jgi:hypothetical protein
MGSFSTLPSAIIFSEAVQAFKRISIQCYNASPVHAYTTKVHFIIHFN